MRNIFLLLVAGMVLMLTLGAGPQVRSIVVEAAADTYVVTDLVTPEDIQTVDGPVAALPNPVMDQNFGRINFVRVWYNAREPEQQQLLSVGLLQFDLGPLKNLEVESVILQAFALRADLTQPARLVDVAVVQDAWIENQVSFNTRPAWSANPISTVAVISAGQWYSWDVTGEVTAAAAQSTNSPSLSFVLGLRTSQEEQEEQVVFTSREAGQNTPRLVVTYT